MESSAFRASGGFEVGVYCDASFREAHFVLGLFHFYEGVSVEVQQHCNSYFG
jgi:hypothetical protein